MAGVNPASLYAKVNIDILRLDRTQVGLIFIVSKGSQAESVVMVLEGTGEGRGRGGVGG